MSKNTEINFVEQMIFDQIMNLVKKVDIQKYLQLRIIEG